MTKGNAPPARPVECLLIDLDDTLYETPLMAKRCAENIRQYMHERLGIAAELVEEQCLSHYLNYGTTLAGLVANGAKIDFDNWHDFVHGTLPYDEYLQPDPELKRLLDSIPCRKFLFTNADRKHAERCLDILGCRDCFAGIIDFETVQAAAEQRGMVHHGRPVVCKPNRQAMDLALQLAGADPATTVFFDDSTRNVAAGVKAGVYSVLVGRTGVDCTADLQLRSMHDLPRRMPWLWGEQQLEGKAAGATKGEREEVGSGGAIGTTVYVQA